jgi:hypothetical protein
MWRLSYSANEGCRFCRLQFTRLLKLGSKIRDITRGIATWWKFWIGNNNDDGEFEESSYSKAFRIRYQSTNGKIISDDYFITKPISAGEEGVGVVSFSKISFKLDLT